MHRSGTSLLASLLPALGVPLPGNLIAGDTHNPEGYYERSDITDLQERLLIDMGQWWPSEAGVLDRPTGWLQRPATCQVAATLRKLLQAELERQPGPWAIKDPRTSLLLPLWRQVAFELEIPLRLVLSVRNPAAVMASLLQRDRLGAGMTSWRAQRLWWRHNRELLLDAAPQQGAELPLLVVNYDAWFDAASRVQQLQALARFCRGNEATPKELAAAATSIRPDYRRSQRAAAALAHLVHPRLLTLHSRLQGLASCGGERTSRPRQSLVRWLTPVKRNRLPSSPPTRPFALRALLIRWRASLVPQVEAGAWFDPLHYRRHAPGLSGDHDPLTHYWWQGWREQRSPHPLFDGASYRQACRDRGLRVVGAPLHHFLTLGLSQDIPPSPVAETAWIAAKDPRRDLWRAARLEGLHPWGAAALALSEDDVEQAMVRLLCWQQQGLNAAELATIAVASPSGFVLTEGLLPERPPIPTRCRVLALGTNLCDWQVHAWLQRCPLPPGFELVEDNNPIAANSVLALVLQPLPPGNASLQLLGLARLECVFARADLVKLLRRLGVNAQPIDTARPANGWLKNQTNDAESCRQLGVPPAAGLASLAPVLTLGSMGEAWERQLSPPVWGWPGFDGLLIDCPQQARLLASWLEACNRFGLQLVRLQPTVAERRIQGWQALSPPPDPTLSWLPPQLFQAPLSPEELQAELRWRARGGPPPAPVSTPEPAFTFLWHSNGPDAMSPPPTADMPEQGPSAAICISLHNYAERIIAALESAHAQSHAYLELIVVDDASSDGGEDRCRAWLERHGQRFRRALLVQHHTNGGLASARNTAFRLARSHWCFVLDADNLLHPEAVDACLALAAASPATIAVVHPLVEVIHEGESGSENSTESSLISGLSWQQPHFLQRNVVDAMALVRRSAWQHVHGYDHIPGGWEDYDFWCKLMEAGYQGVLCPQRLATYHQHAASMLATETHKRLRVVSRQLQQRHPWLQLPLAAGLMEGWNPTP